MTDFSTSRLSANVEIIAWIAQLVSSAPDRKGNLETNAMKRVAAERLSPDSLAVETAKRLDDRNDYCLGCSFLPSANTRYSFLHLIGLGRALQARIGRTWVRSRLDEHVQPPNKSNYFSCLREKPDGTNEIRTGDL